MKTAVVFDVDDTLYLERDYVSSGFKAVGAFLQGQMACEGFFEVAWRLFESGVRNTIFDEALPEVGVEPTALAIGELVSVYRSHAPVIAVTPDAEELLSTIVGSSFLAIITDGPAVSQRHKVESLGADEWSDLTIYTAELGEGKAKPHPEAFEKVMRISGVHASRHLYVGDNPKKDFKAPAELGWTTVRVRRCGQLHEDEPSGDDVGVEISSLAELRYLIGGS